MQGDRQNMCKVCHEGQPWSQLYKKYISEKKDLVPMQFHV